MLCVLLVLLTAAVAHGETFGLEHSFKVFRVTEPRIAPRGDQVVFVVSRPNYTANSWDSELYRLDIKSRSSIALTYGRRTVRRPRWSASGDEIAFLATVDGKSQIFRINTTGGEAQQITTAPRGVQQYD